MMSKLPSVPRQDNLDPTQAENEFDWYLMPAGDTLETATRAIGVLLLKTGGTLILKDEELKRLDGFRLEHGRSEDGSVYAWRLVDKNEPTYDVGSPDA